MPGPDAQRVHLDPMTPLGLLERTLRVFPERPAVVYGELRWSYRRFADEVGRLAGALVRAGIAPGDRVAFVALRPGAGASERELIEFCRERLAHFKCPKAIEFTELPKTSTGKIQKFRPREKEWAGRGKRIQG